MAASGHKLPSFSRLPCYLHLFKIHTLVQPFFFDLLLRSTPLSSFTTMQQRMKAQKSWRRILRRLFSSLWRRRRSISTTAGSKSHELGDASPDQKPTWVWFSYEELLRATNGFLKENMVGRGGQAEVFKGMLCDGRAIAVKRVSRSFVGINGGGSGEKEFLTELGTVSHARHPNVSSLIGCCIDRDLHLVFDFFPNGSVSSHLHGEDIGSFSSAMPWKRRHKIALGTARGLCYLHRDCRRRIIHRDIKASNILLDADYEPKISDFGLAKWLPSEWTHRAVKPIEGTFGCLAPEYFKHGVVGEETDVFAFGVFLLEIISGRKPVDGAHRSLLLWAKPYLKNEAMVGLLVDPRLGGSYDAAELRRLAFAAALCTRAAAASRPSMSELLDVMTGEVDVPGHDWRASEEEEEQDDDFMSWAVDFDDEEVTAPTSPLWSAASSSGS